MSRILARWMLLTTVLTVVTSMARISMLERRETPPDGLFRGALPAMMVSTSSMPTGGIVIGYMPLLIPASHTIEIMRRDRLLDQELRRLGKTLRFVSGRDETELAGRLGTTLQAVVVGPVAATQLAAQGYLLMSRFPAALFSLALRGRTPSRHPDLAGRRLACTPGSLEHHLTTRLLNSLGIAGRGVSMVDLKGADPLRALGCDVVDGFGAMEPLPTIAARNSRGLTRLGQLSTHLYLVVDSRAVSANLELLQGVVQAQARAVHWLKGTGKNVHLACSWVRSSESRYLRPGLRLDLIDMDRLANQSLAQIGPRTGLSSRSDQARTELREAFDFNRIVGGASDSAAWEKVESQLSDLLVNEVPEGSQPQFQAAEVERQPFL